MQKNRRFNAGKQFRRLPVYSFRVCRKIRELLPGKNATVPGGIMDAASPSREHGTALVPEPTQCRNTGMSNLPAEISAAENTVLPPLPEPAQCRNTGMPNLPAEISGCRTTGRLLCLGKMAGNTTSPGKEHGIARRNIRLPHDQGGSARTMNPDKMTGNTISPGRETGTAPHGGQRHTAGGRKARAA